jgi:hypothetical protein
MMSGYYVEEPTNGTPIKIKQRMTPFNRMGLSYLSEVKARAERRGDVEEANGALAEIERRKNNKVKQTHLYIEEMKKKIETNNSKLEEIQSIVPAPETPSMVVCAKKTRKPRRKNSKVITVPVLSAPDTDSLVADITLLKERINSYLKEHPVLKNIGVSINL